MNFSSRTNTVGSPYESERRKISEEANEHKCNVDRIDNDINKLNTTYQKVVENDIPNPEIHSNIPKSSGCNLVIKGDSHIFQSVNIAKQHTNESSPKFNNNFEEKVDKIQKSDEVKEPQSPEIRRDRHPKMFHVVKKAFDFYDKDRSGKLEISEIGELLYDICSSMGHFFSDEKLEKCHQIQDENQDGNVQFNELLRNLDKIHFTLKSKVKYINEEEELRRKNHRDPIDFGFNDAVLDHMKKNNSKQSRKDKDWCHEVNFDNKREQEKNKDLETWFKMKKAIEKSKILSTNLKESFVKDYRQNIEESTSPVIKKKSKREKPKKNQTSLKKKSKIGNNSLGQSELESENKSNTKKSRLMKLDTKPINTHKSSIERQEDNTDRLSDNASTISPIKNINIAPHNTHNSHYFSVGELKQYRNFSARMASDDNQIASNQFSNKINNEILRNLNNNSLSPVGGDLSGINFKKNQTLDYKQLNDDNVDHQHEFDPIKKKTYHLNTDRLYNKLQKRTCKCMDFKPDKYFLKYLDTFLTYTPKLHFFDKYNIDTQAELLKGAFKERERWFKIINYMNDFIHSGKDALCKKHIRKVNEAQTQAQNGTNGDLYESVKQEQLNPTNIQFCLIGKNSKYFVESNPPKKTKQSNMASLSPKLKKNLPKLNLGGSVDNVRLENGISENLSAYGVQQGGQLKKNTMLDKFLHDKKSLSTYQKYRDSVIKDSVIKRSIPTNLDQGWINHTSDNDVLIKTNYGKILKNEIYKITKKYMDETTGFKKKCRDIKYARGYSINNGKMDSQFSDNNPSPRNTASAYQENNDYINININSNPNFVRPDHNSQNLDPAIKRNFHKIYGSKRPKAQTSRTREEPKIDNTSKKFEENLEIINEHGLQESLTDEIRKSKHHFVNDVLLPNTNELIQKTVNKEIIEHSGENNTYTKTMYNFNNKTFM